MTWKLHIVIMLVGISAYKSRRKMSANTHIYAHTNEHKVKWHGKNDKICERDVWESELLALHNTVYADMKVFHLTMCTLYSVYTPATPSQSVSQQDSQPAKINQLPNDMPIKTFSPISYDLSSSTPRVTCVCEQCTCIPVCMRVCDVGERKFCAFACVFVESIGIVPSGWDREFATKALEHLM